jgi:hypothetical protein
MNIPSVFPMLGVIFALSACGGEEVLDIVSQLPLPPGSGSGSGSGSGGSGGGGNVPAPTPQAPQSPNYGVNGFSVSRVSEVTSVVTVLETDPRNNDVSESYRSGTPRDLRIVYDPANGTLTLRTEALAADGTPDGESAVMTSINGSRNAFRGQGPQNEASVATGRYAWSLSARYDQDDGRFRHNLAAAGGQTFLSLPTSGEGRYDARLDGMIEQYDANSSGNFPYRARGNVNVSFGSGQVTSLFNVDPALSNGTSGNVSSTGSFTNGGNFRGSSEGRLVIEGRAAAVSGQFVGFVAGPNAEEVAGVKSLRSPAGSPTVTTMDGAFLGADASR